MKRIIVLIGATFLMVACGSEKEKSVEDVISSGDLAEIRIKRNEIANQLMEFTAQLSSLDSKIASLDDNSKIALITSIKAQEEVFNHFLEFQGNLSTKNLLIIYPEFSGILIRVDVKEGDRVTEGQVLAKIDDGGLSQQLAQLQINLELAKTTFERQERLWKEKIGSELQYLNAKSGYESQEKAIAQLKKQINKTIVTAPFSGIIDEMMTEQGSFVMPGQSPLFRLINLDNMYIETEVPENYISSVKTNKNVEIEFPATDVKMKAKISQVGNYINPANRTFKIEVPVPNKDGSLKPNLTAKIRINDYTNNKALLIPQSIISENAKGEQYIYLVKNRKDSTGTSQKVIIETGKFQGDFVEILKGIKQDDEIIREGARSIEDGQEVKIINRN